MRMVMWLVCRKNNLEVILPAVSNCSQLFVLQHAIAACRYLRSTHPDHRP